jgi:FemAB-related protein (PEP-CTERM system-associated)
MGLTLRPLEAAGTRAWDAFVYSRPDGTFFHLAAWRAVIERAFGHPTHYTVAEQDGAIVGILPLAHVRTLLFGNTLVSLPFCVYGGPLAVDADAALALEAHADALMESTGAHAIEFRYRDQTDNGWIERPELYVTFRKPIAADEEKNLKAIPRKQRAMVRKGMQNGLVSVVTGETDVLHRVYGESVRNLGTPVFSRRYFRLLAESFGGCYDVVIVLDRDRPIAGVMNFYYRDEVLPYYGGGTQEARQRAGNDFMYWEVMRRAAARGCRLFDFGRSKLGTGSYAFKRNWGFQPMPLRYRYKLGPGRTIPDHNPLNPKYRLFIAGWKRLPLPVANAIGPHIVRGLG